MADGIKISSPSLAKNMARLRQIAPNLDAEMTKASEKSARDLAGLAKGLAPSGDYAQSIEAKPVAETAKGKVWGVVASWIWRFIEFGTPAGDRTEKRGPRSGTVVHHPGTRPHPHIYPAYRLLRKRIKGRMKRAMNKAAKDALK